MCLEEGRLLHHLLRYTEAIHTDFAYTANFLPTMMSLCSWATVTEKCEVFSMPFIDRSSEGG